jgi:hypothetical protein
VGSSPLSVPFFDLTQVSLSDFQSDARFFLVRVDTATSRFDLLTL